MKYETQLFGGQTNLHCMKQILHNAKSNSHGCIRLAICIATAFAVVIRAMKPSESIMAF